MYKHTWPRISDNTKNAIIHQIDKGEISIYDRSGIFETFENEFAASLNRKYGLVVSSGTAALHTAMVACGFANDDEIICPAYTFFATVTPIFQTGAIPILCDAGTDGNIDPTKIEALITSKTKAIIITHMWGIPCDIDAIMALCRQYNLLLIEDCSHAHGALYKGQSVGSHGDIAAFSLQGQKIVTGGEGGILVTNNTEMYERSLLFGHYNKRSRQEIRKNSPYYDYAVTGFGLKLRAHPFAVAMMHEQFSHLPAWHATKHKNALYLSRQLSVYPQLELPQIADQDTEPSWYAYTFKIKKDSLTISTKEFCQKLIEAGILDADMPGSTCPLNLHKLFQEPGLLFPNYNGKIAYKKGDFPTGETFFEQAIKLPIDTLESDDYRGVLDFYATTIGEQLALYKIN